MSISDHKYVSVTTFRNSGATVASPVWIAPLGNGTAGFTTGADSGKVKRLRKKYGLIVVSMGIGTRLMTLIGRKPDNCAIIITVPGA